MDDKTIQAISKALKSGLRVELMLDQDGRIVAQTICRKRLKCEYVTRGVIDRPEGPIEVNL